VREKFKVVLPAFSRTTVWAEFSLFTPHSNHHADSPPQESQEARACVRWPWSYWQTPKASYVHLLSSLAEVLDAGPLGKDLISAQCSVVYVANSSVESRCGARTSQPVASGRGNAGGMHHHRILFDKYHPGYFGKVSVLPKVMKCSKGTAFAPVIANYAHSMARVTPCRAVTVVVVSRDN
jgi:hypothetical protein